MALSPLAKPRLAESDVSTNHRATRSALPDTPVSSDTLLSVLFVFINVMRTIWGIPATTNTNNVEVWSSYFLSISQCAFSHSLLLRVSGCCSDIPYPLHIFIINPFGFTRLQGQHLDRQQKGDSVERWPPAPSQ